MPSRATYEEAGLDLNKARLAGQDRIQSPDGLPGALKRIGRNKVDRSNLPVWLEWSSRDAGTVPPLADPPVSGLDLLSKTTFLTSRAGTTWASKFRIPNVA